MPHREDVVDLKTGSKSHENLPSNSLGGRDVVGPIWPRMLRHFLTVLAICTVLFTTGGWFVQDMLATPTASAQGQVGNGVLAVVGADGAQLYETPAGDVVGELETGKTLTAVGRSEDSGWAAVITSDDQTGWVPVKSLVLFGVDNLPVVFGEVAEMAMDEDSADDGASESADAVEATATATVPPTPTPTPLPTDTPTPAPTPTPVPTATPTDSIVASSGLLAVVRGGGADLLGEPNGDSVASLGTGTTLNALGQTEDGNWLMVRTTTGATGWVDGGQVIAFQTADLPVVDGAMARESMAADESDASDADDSESSDNAMEDSEDSDAEDGDSEDSDSEESNAEDAEDTDTEDARTSDAETDVAPSPRQSPENPDDLPIARVDMAGSRLNVRAGPGTNYAIVSKALPDEEFTSTGRNEAGDWVQIEVPEIDDGFGWVSVRFIELSEAVSDLPVSDETSSAPVATPAPNTPPSSAPDASSNTSDDGAMDNTTETKAVAVSAAPVGGLQGKIVFQESLGGNIYAYSFASGSLQRLTTGMDPAISPDGSMVAFTRHGGNAGVYLINIDGSDERRLYAGDDGPRQPTWSPDGKYVAFTRVTGEYTCKNIGFGICLKPNPFLSTLPDDNKPERNISRMDLAGKNFRDIAALNTAQAPDWIDAGIVYQATTSIEITREDAEADENRHVINEQVGYKDPDWQPGGGRIVFQRQGHSHWDLWAINPDGSGESPLTAPVTTLVDNLPSNVSPAWSPDGQYIVYVSNRAADEEAGAYRLWVMNADGSNKRQLPINIDLTYHHNIEQMVSWGL